MKLPKSCGKCKYGNTYDMSVDDLHTYCYITGFSQDWCNFPNRINYDLRMGGCPMPNLSVKQKIVGGCKILIHKLKKRLSITVANSNVTFIRELSDIFLVFLCKRVDTGGLSLEWFMAKDH